MKANIRVQDRRPGLTDRMKEKLMTKYSLLAGAALLLAAPLNAQMAAHADHAMSEPPARPVPPMVRADIAAQVKAQFAKMDANKDGAITRDEIAAHQAAQRKEMQDRMFANMDANKDGAISKGEFDAHHKDMARHMMMEMDAPDMPMPPPGRMAPEGPDKIIITRKIMGGPGGMIGDGHMFGMADADKDGKVTEAEALTYALGRFDQADTNKDGKITPDERRERRVDIRKVMRDRRAN
jgi:Ca2+-binding EF-hand superfamily protein